MDEKIGKIFLTPDDKIEVKLVGGIKAVLKPLIAEDVWEFPVIAKVGNSIAEGKEVNTKDKERFFEFLAKHTKSIDGNEITKENIKNLRFDILLSLMNEIMGLSMLSNVEKSFPAR